MNKMWGSNEPDKIKEVDDLGCKLSIAIDCPVHKMVPAMDILECRHGVVFPLYLLRKGNWAAIKRRHDEEQRYV